MSNARLGLVWRFAALAGLTLGLGLSPAVGVPPAQGRPILLVAALALGLTRPRGTGAVAWTCLVAFVAALAGLSLGSARLESLESRRLEPDAGATITVRGFVIAPPRQSPAGTTLVLETPGGRIAVRGAAGPAAVPVGHEVVATGQAHPAQPWEAALLARQGASFVVEGELRATGARRGGVPGALDRVRERAEAALGRGTAEPSAALLRGFVLGQDDRIPDPVRDEFRRAGLGHLVAVSGQNVMLLALLAVPLLALLGMPLRLRLLTVLGLVAAYVPVTGAGPSIQRAGVMGAAGIVAALAGRPSSRWYAVLLAACVTLALDPRASADVGWQLSFAAVIAIIVLAAPLTAVLSGAAGRRTSRMTVRRALAEGAALTLAATLVTAPLAAHHFGTVSVTAIPANLLALPAVAPAMWLGMLAGGLGQFPGAPVEPLSWLGGLCSGYIGWVAHALGGPWAQLDVAPPGPLAVALWCVLLGGGAWLAVRFVARRRRMGPRSSPGGLPARRLFAGLALTAVVLGVALAGSRGGDPGPVGDPGLRLTVLDVGQGDAILLRPRGAGAILFDTGPLGSGVAERLRELGVERLAALVITHDQSDHAGALGELLDMVSVERLVHGPGPAPRACRSALTCPPSVRVSAGSALRAGRLRLQVLWPRADARGGDPNAAALVVRARYGAFDALLTGDAEAELAPIAVSPVEVLKVAHHGSADAGLGPLLDRASPRLALISVGEGNPYGHPAPETLAELADHAVPVMRTDRDGDLAIEVRGDRWGVE